MDLVSMQQSSKRIKNPFGFDFIHTWNKKQVVIKGDGKEVSLIGALADHMAYHLFQKVRNQYHDEQVAALKAKGDMQGARKFRVSQGIENKIMMMITGKPFHKEYDPDQVARDNADLGELKKEITKLNTMASRSTGVKNISKIINEANVKALKQAGDLPAGESTSVRGAGSLDSEDLGLEATEPDLVDTQAELDQETVAEETAPEDAGTDETADKAKEEKEFADLEDLD